MVAGYARACLGEESFLERREQRNATPELLHRGARNGREGGRGRGGLRVAHCFYVPAAGSGSSGSWIPGPRPQSLAGSLRPPGLVALLPPTLRCAGAAPFDSTPFVGARRGRLAIPGVGEGQCVRRAPGYVYVRCAPRFMSEYQSTRVPGPGTCHQLCHVSAAGYGNRSNWGAEAQDYSIAHSKTWVMSIARPASNPSSLELLNVTGQSRVTQSPR